MKVFNLLLSELVDRGYNCFVVGGWIRDFLIGKSPKDIDFVTSAKPEEIMNVCEELNLHWKKPSLESGTIKVLIPGTKDIFDIRTMRKSFGVFTDNIVEDLKDRDFAINAMAVRYPPTSPLEVIDPFEGQEDIKSKVIQFIGHPDERIKEDPMRMLRMLRFSCIDYGWCPVDIEYLAKNKDLIKTIPREKIRDEIIRSLNTDYPGTFWTYLQVTGLLEIIFPDLARGAGCKQNQFHSEDVLEHLIRCLNASVQFTDNPMLRLAILLHDIAKPHTKEVVEDRVTFHKHEVVGSSIVYNWMRQMKFGQKDCIYVSKLVRFHQFYFDEKTTDKAIRHWLRDTGKDIWRDLLILRMADRMGNLKKANLPVVTKEMWELETRIENLLANNPILFLEDLAINGNDLKELDIKPGPRYKEILSTSLAWVMDNPEKNNKKDLLSYIKRIFIS